MDEGRCLRWKQWVKRELERVKEKRRLEESAKERVRGKAQASL